MAIYKEEVEKEGIRRAFNVFLAQEQVNFTGFCKKHELDRISEYQKIFRYKSLDEKDVNRLVSKADAGLSLKKIGEIFVINKGFRK